jgi:PKD repeat protein
VSPIFAANRKEADVRHLRARRYPLLLAGVLLLPALGTWASPPRRKPAAAQPAASTFHLFTDPLPPAPALPLENIPIGSSSDGGSPHFHLQSRMALKGDRVFVAFLDDTSQAAAFTLSTDGGRSFSAQRASPIPGQIFGTPDATFGINGELLFVSTPTYDGIPRLARSTDGGETFAQAYAVWKQFQAQDPRLAVDTSTSSAYRGNVYVTAYDYPFDYYGGTDFSRSTDGGKTFSDPPARVDDYVRAAAPVIAPNGSVFIAAMTWDNSAGVSRPAIRISTDGGRSFGPDRAVAPVPWTASSLGIAADSYGVIHIVFDASPPDSKSDRSDVFYVRSTDGGISFSEPRRLNDDGGTTSQTGPSIAAGPRGLLAVKWFDRRNDSASDILSDVYMAISADGGLSFGRNLRVTDHNWFGYPPDVGSLMADSTNFYLSWTDLRNGNEEIFYAYVPPTQPVGTPDFSISPLKPYDVMLAGRTASFDVRTNAINGYSGDLTLTATGPPGGPAIAFDSGSVRAGDGAKVQVAASRETKPGTYLVTVTAEGKGLKRSTELRINVHDPDRRATLPLDISSSRGAAGAISKPAMDRRGVITVAYTDDSESVGKPLSTFRRSFDRGRTYTDPVVSSLTLRAFTVDPDGGLYALHEKDGDLFVSRSTDGGTSFISTIALTNAHGGSTFVIPAIAADGNGHVVAAWMDSFSGGSQALNVVQSSDAGATFGPAVRLEGPSQDLWIGSLDVAIDSKGTEFVCYAKSDRFGQAARLAVAQVGQAFGAARDILSGSTFTGFSLGNDDVIHVADMDGIGAVRLVTSSDGGLSFGAPVDLYKIDLSVTGSSAPLVVSDRVNGVTVAWSTESAGDVFYRRSTDGGRTFGPTGNLSTNPGSSWNPVGAADAYGNVLILWNDDSPGRQHVLAAWIGSTQTFDVPLSVFILEPSVDPQIEATASSTFSGTGVGPDLTAAFTYEWDFGDGTTGSGEHVTHVFAVPGVHTVVLTVIDSAGRRGTASRLITVRAPAQTQADTDLVLPVVADSRGVGASHYTTELTLVSRASRPVTALLQYTAAVGSGSGYASLTLAPGEERVIPDAVVFLRSRGLPIPGDGSAQIGTLRVVFSGAAPGEVFLGGRTSTSSGNGTYGLFYPSAAMSESALAVIGLQENDALRSNLALLNTGDSEVTLRVQLLGANGEDLGLLPDQTLVPLGWTQFNRPLEGLANAGRAVVTRVAGTSTFSAYGVLLDNVTSDGSFIPPLPAGISGSDRLIPVVLDARGVNAVHYTTELTLANLSAGPLELSFTYTAVFGTGSGTVKKTLSAGQQLVVPNAIAFLRAGGLAIPSDGQDLAGSLMVAAGSADFAAGARTFSHAPTGAGTYGVYYSGLTSEESAASTAFVYGLQQNAAQRSSLAVVNRGDAGDALNLSLSYFDAHGSSLGDPVPVRLVPGEWRQFNQPLGTRGASSGYVRVERVSGSSRFVAYGVLNDNATSDGSYIPMTR